MANRDHEAICQECEQPIIKRRSGEHHDAELTDIGHYHQAIERIIHRHYLHVQRYQMLQEESGHRLIQHESSKLHVLDHLLKKHIRPIMDRVQNELCEHGFHTGITEDTVSLDIDNKTNTFLVGLTLHMADVPIVDDGQISKHIYAHNILRFYRSGQEQYLDCQFSNHKCQSRVFQLYFSHQERELYQAVRDIFSDFISFTLLYRRAEIIPLS